MGKNTLSLKSKLRWLEAEGMFLMLFAFLFSCWGGNAQTYTYTGSVQTVTLAPGSYQIEMWGGDGGGTTGTNANASVAKRGGVGGYASGTLTLTATTTVNIYVGGKGGTEGLAVPGGFNGGGASGGGTGVSGVCGSGGGASDIRLNGTALTDRVIVAGGGGGAGYQECNGLAGAISGGHGGGLTGGAPVAGGYINRIGQGGTQTAGGAGGTEVNYGATAGAGSFGLGGAGGTATSTSGNGAGGGGGWYGGGAGSHGFYCAGGGGGGSSYIGGVSAGVSYMYGQSGFVPNPDPNGNGTVVITNMAPCTGTPVAGTAQASENNICPAPFNLSLSGATTGGGITYQWQSSPLGANNWTDISGATGVFYTVVSPTVSLDYRCVVVCSHSSSQSISNVVTVLIKSANQCFCTPTYTYACTSTSENINSFILVGEGTSNITDLNTACSPGNYGDRTALFSPVDLLQDGAYVVQMNTTYSSGSFVWANLWIDFNDNGVFEPTEQLIKDLPMATTPAFVSPTIVIPASASPGVHRMRVRSNYNSTVDACANGSWGEAHDYEVNIIAVTCYRPTIASVIKASATSVNVTLNASPLNTGTVTYEYEVRTSGQPGSGGAGLVTTGTTSNLNFVISGLQAGLVYTVYVRTDCGSNDFSQYSFYEFGIPASLPYTQDFESAQTGWILSNGGATNEWHVGNAVSSGGNRSLYITNDQGSSNAYTISSATVVHAYKDFELLTGTTEISIAFDWRALAESCCDYIRVWMVPTSFTPSAGTQIAAATGRVNITNNLNMDANFKTFQAIRSATAYTGTFRVVFEWRNDGSLGTIPPGAIDNIEIKRVTCYQPTNVVLSNIKHNGVTVTVTPDSKNTSTVTYEYEVRTSGTAGSGANGLVTSGTSPNTTFNITSLPPDTDLQVYVRTSCGSSDKSFWNSRDFRTLEVLDTVMVKADIDCYDADNGSIDFTTTGGKTPYVYTWTPPVSTSESAANLTPGVYVIVIEDDSGQVINNTVTIYEPPQIISNLDVVNISCNGQNNGSASISPNGGVTPYTAIWSDNTIGFTNNNLAPGAYSVTIRDANGCPLTEHFVIDEPAVLASSIDTLTHVSVYGGSDGSVTLDVTGGTQPYTYDWTPLVSTSDSASGLTAGTYTVVITDANGCSVTQVVDITEPLPPFEIHLVSLDDVSCNGSNDGSIVVNVIGPNPPFTYSWSPSGGNGTTASN